MHHNQILGEFQAKARGDHQRVQMDGHRLGVDDHLALFVDVAIAHIGFDGQVGLALGVVAAFGNHVGGVVEEGSGIRAFFFKLFVIDVGSARVDFDGVRSHGFGGAHVFGQQLKVKLDLFSRSAGIAFRIGAHDGKGVAVLEDLGIVKDRTFPAVTLVGGEGDKTGDTVSALHVLVGDHLIHAGHFFGFRCVDALDESVRNLGLSKGQVQGVGGQAVRRIRAKFGSAGNLGNGSGTRNGGTPDAAIGGHLEGHVVQRFVAAHKGGGVHNGVHQGLVARAAAHVVVFLEPVAHVLAAGIGIGIKQGLGRNDETGGAETALGRTVEDPGVLDGMQIGGRAHTFKGGNGSIFGHTVHLDNAGAYNFAVKNYRTSTTLAFAAANLDAGELQLVAQHVHQHIFRFNHQTPGDAVNDKGL